MTKTIYIHCQQILNSFVWALKTERKVSLWQAFFGSFIVIANKFKIYRQYTTVYCVYKKSKTTELYPIIYLKPNISNLIKFLANYIHMNFQPSIERKTFNPQKLFRYHQQCTCIGHMHQPVLCQNIIWVTVKSKNRCSK